jgi:hypothetical protein
MITFKPIPRESTAAVRRVTPQRLHNFIVHSISKSKIDPEEMSWVATKVADMLRRKKKDMTNEEINTAIEYIRFLLSKMLTLKTKNLVRVARELFSPGEGRKTNIASFPRRKKLTGRHKKVA